MASQSSTIQSSTSMSSPTLLLNPALGEGREERWEKVQEIVGSKVAPLYGDRSKLLKKVEANSHYKCRLLYEDKTPVGVLIYKTSSSKHLDSSLTIKILQGDNLTNWSSANKVHLMEELYKTAREKNFKHLGIKLSPEDTKVVEFVQERGFKKSNSLSNQDALFFYQEVPSASSINSSSSHKRRMSDGDRYEKRQKEGEEGAYRRISMGSSENKYAGIPGVVIPTIRSSSSKAAEKPQEINARLVTSTIQMKYLRYIQSGQKTIEGRINTGMFEKLVKGQKIKFFCQQESAVCEITAIKSYPSFGEMLRQEGVQKCLPDVRSLDEGIRIYNSIKGYPERAARFGVLAIHIKKIE